MTIGISISIVLHLTLVVIFRENNKKRLIEDSIENYQKGQGKVEKILRRIAGIIALINKIPFFKGLDGEKGMEKMFQTQKTIHICLTWAACILEILSLLTGAFQKDINKTDRLTGVYAGAFILLATFCI